MSDQALTALADLLAECHRHIGTLVDVIEHDDSPRHREQARRALMTNAYTVASIARYLADPPSFSWHLVRTPVLTDCPLAECHRPAELTIHT